METIGYGTNWIDVALWIWFALTAISVAFVAWDLFTRTPEMKVMKWGWTFADESFDRVVSSLFFHHLTRENKLKTLREVRRVLKRGGEFHIADWGLPANLPMKFSSRFIQMLDGFETTADNFNGLLPKLLADTGFENIEETNSFSTLFGTIRLHKAYKT